MYIQNINFSNFNSSPFLYIKKKKIQRGVNTVNIKHFKSILIILSSQMFVELNLAIESSSKVPENKLS